MPTATLHRKDRELKGKELSANTLASILVAQGVTSVADLATNRSMPVDLLLFLNRQRAVGYWRDNGWFRSEGNQIYLTDQGLNEVEEREAGVALSSNGRKKPGNVSPALVADARRFIESGQSDEEVTVLSREFEI